MPETQEPFGRRANLLSEVDPFLQLEFVAHRSDQFSQLDRIIAEVIRHSLSGERVAAFSRDKVKGYQAALTCLTGEQREYVHSMFAVEAQQSRGAWFLPTYASLRIGNLHIPYAFAKNGRFAMELIGDERGSVALAGNPEAVLLWSLLDSFFENLFRPITLRGGRSEITPPKSREAQLKEWAEIDSFYQTLGLELGSELAVMRYGGGWHRLRAAEQQAAKSQLLDTIARQNNPELMAKRYRAMRIRALVTAYYKKAKDGRALRTRVLNRTLERTLASYFGGGWLAFLNYLGEQPHQDEQIVTALPQTQLLTAGSERAAEAASQLGIPVEEARLALETFWQAPGGASPVEQRVAFMKEYWQVFNYIHARQQSGMKPLWGLVDEWAGFSIGREYGSPHQPGLYRELLPGSIQREIEGLWRTRVLPAYPERLVTEAFPHVSMAQTFGPALKFWHGCSLTAWFPCEGPYSRTDMPGLAQYHAKELAVLRDLGTPVDTKLFDELIRAQALLGPPEPIYTSQETHKGYGSMTFTVGISNGNRRTGFERLRDIITKHRKLWTERNLDRYLEAHWESEVRKAARDYEITTQQKNKAPKPQQFARFAEPALNHWFGGNIASLYAALGDKSPIEVSYQRMMPHDIEGLTRAVFTALKDGWQQPVDSEQARLNSDAIARLAENSVLFVQLEEALGRKPTLKEFGSLQYDYYWSALGSSSEEAWEKYYKIVEDTKQALEVSPNNYAPAVSARPSESPEVSKQSVPQVRNETSVQDTEMYSVRNSQSHGRDSSIAQRDRQPARKKSLLDRLLGR